MTDICWVSRVWVIEIRDGRSDRWTCTVDVFLMKDCAQHRQRYWREQGFETRVTKYVRAK